MKIKQIIEKIDDPKLYIEIIDKDYISYGLYTKNELIYNTKFNNDKILSIDVQYFNKRVLILYIDR